MSLGVFDARRCRIGLMRVASPLVGAPVASQCRPVMLLDVEQLEQLYAAMREGRRIRIRLDDGRSGRRSARTFLGVPTAIGPWGASNETHVVIQMLGAHGTMVAVAVQLGRVVAVDTDV